MDFQARFRHSGSRPRRVTVTLSLTPGNACQFRDLMDGEKFFVGPYAMVKLSQNRAAELGIEDASIWNQFDPNATVYRAELGDGRRRTNRTELPAESWCQPNERRA